ncbi:MAG: hypothetical protein EOO79_07455 [Oxalobacteraceae bacterium]|nr:MAG: hypothetical protein EOO79_07455 [Oxalobacteraceae bacterium]
MTAVTKAPVSIFAAVVAAGGTKLTPASGGAGDWKDVTAYNGGLLGGRIKNTAGAVGAPGQMTWQWTPDPTATTVKIYDLYTWGGDIAANGDYTFSMRLDKEVKFVRALCYGNTTNQVTYESDLAASS